MSNLNNFEKPLTEEEKEELKSFIFVTEKTHLKIVCTCPECGKQFFNWLQGGNEADLDTILMEMSTTDCSFCVDEAYADEDCSDCDL